MGDINKVINSENETNFKLIDNIFKLTDLSKVIIISGIGVTKKDEYIEASKKLFIKKNEVIGNIIIEDIALDEDKTDYIETIIIRTKTLIKKGRNLIPVISNNYSWKIFKHKLNYYLELIKKKDESKGDN